MHKPGTYLVYSSNPEATKFWYTFKGAWKSL